VSSEQGKDGSFPVYLHSCEAAGPEAEQPRTMRGGRRGRVLVMDDETMIRHVAKEMIEMLGHQVECTENGADAVEKFRQAKTAGRPFDVVILDLTVKAGMGGEQAIRILREIDPEVKAIVSSGYSDNAVVSDHKTYGFAAFLNKPYTIDALRDCIDSLLA